MLLNLFQSLKKKISKYKQEASRYENKITEERNGIESGESVDRPKAQRQRRDTDGRIRRLGRRHREANGDTERDEEDDEGDSCTRFFLTRPIRTSFSCDAV